MYTTRPIRAGETDGVQYHFVTEEQLKALEHAGKVIELRTYQTVYGPWHYFTADSPELSNADIDYLALGTLESFRKIQEYYGKEKSVSDLHSGRGRAAVAARKSSGRKSRSIRILRRYAADILRMRKTFQRKKLQAAGITRSFFK